MRKSVLPSKPPTVVTTNVGTYKFEALVTDLDGTLVPAGQRELNSATRILLERSLQKTEWWIVATGRPRDYVEHFFDNWAIQPDAFVTQNQFGFYRDDNQLLALPEWNTMMKRCSQKIQQTATECFRSLRNWASERFENFRVTDEWARFNSIYEARQARYWLQNKVEGQIKVNRNGCSISLLPSVAGKGAVLNELCGKLGLYPEQVLCIGNSENDRGMLDGRYGFQSAAVSTAEETIKQAVKNNGGIAFTQNIETELESLVGIQLKEGVATNG